MRTKDTRTVARAAPPRRTRSAPEQFRFVDVERHLLQVDERPAMLVPLIIALDAWTCPVSGCYDADVTTLAKAARLPVDAVRDGLAVLARAEMIIPYAEIRRTGRVRGIWDVAYGFPCDRFYRRHGRWPELQQLREPAFAAAA